MADRLTNPSPLTQGTATRHGLLSSVASSGTLTISPSSPFAQGSGPSPHLYVGGSHTRPHSHGAFGGLPAAVNSGFSPTTAFGVVHKPIPMKLFAIGDLDRTPAFCTPRICSVRLTRLVICKCLEEGLTSVTIAVKMERSKRTLRSAEIDLPDKTGGLLDTELDLSLSLQYPHYLKQRGNLLLVMLQRRKKYKNRRILGFKTLAIGGVDMNEVLQRSVDQELNLYANAKSKENVVARIQMVSLATQPVSAPNGKEPLALEDDNTSEEDEYLSDVSDSEADAGDDPENVRLRAHTHPRHHHAPGGEGSGGVSGKSRRKMVMGRQGNFKQKFISLLRRFKASETGFDPDVDVDIDPEQAELDANEKAVLEDELLDELDFDSDSAPEFFDNISVQSTPRPHLSPYFKPGRSGSTLMLASQKPTDSGLSPLTGGSGGATASGLTPDSATLNVTRLDKNDEASRNNSDSHPDNLTDEDGTAVHERRPEESGGKETEKKPKAKALVLREKSWSMRDKDKKPASDAAASLPRDVYSVEGPGRKFSQAFPVDPLPRAVLMEQLQHVFPSPDDELPTMMVWVNGQHALGRPLVDKFCGGLGGAPAVAVASIGDLKACFAQLVARFQRLQFSRAASGQHQPVIRVVLCGGDEFVNATLRVYVETFSERPTDWQNGIRFIFVPLGQSGLARFILQADTLAGKVFDEISWFAALEHTDPDDVDWEHIVGTMKLYIQSAEELLSLPVAQAMINIIKPPTQPGPAPPTDQPDSPQLFIPFLIDVRVSGGPDLPVKDSLETEERDAAGLTPHDTRDFSPPNSPNLAHVLGLGGGGEREREREKAGELMELQVDFWMPGSQSSDERSKKTEVILSVTETPGSVASRAPHKAPPKDIPSVKTSLKAPFKFLYVVRPITQAQPGGSAVIGTGGNVFTLLYAVKEKKIPLMRALAKKPKDSETRTVREEPVTRLICRISKPQGTTMKVAIDGCDWHHINFFQLSTPWHSTVKTFPLLISQPT
ncbi:phosphofurin acidic cluster sorting protein 2-like [Paramacrobiotus metropolitanus]|uniref:phosphofurin acidic cluster sorting protein 2-like n=1 Tax=Paramacrobiotus metropolitanus TaxID=2943436 RepID=UPI002445DD08|nr:phosphofurin acidic cluster sorting protein 2-like [Paramacrobiotus metropolitanus]XP_055350855.1 phosphofurin acidic cluster sorting protein 2-like [Paramacrobiotus metropolitanus]XP_055350857.1 phosphofurin acidic cluster sorting protein 2-like [Paramacrobiotus metropolitanus]